jgi:Flp pilus assembly protein TadG
MALALACLVGVALAAFGTQSALAQKGEARAKKPAEGVRALVLGEARSPVLDDLKRSQGWRLTRAANAQGRANGPAKYDALVVDGDALSPEQLGEGTLVDGFADAGRWVLALDTDPADYDLGLRDNTGFTAGQRSGESRMFLFGRQMLNNTPHVLMVEAKSLQPTQSADVSEEERRSITAQQIRKAASTATRAVSADQSTLQEEFTAQQGEDATPEEVQHVKWDYNVTDRPGVTPAGYWLENEDQSGLQEVPAPGQDAWTRKTETQSFGVYLDNGEGRPQGNFQYVTYDFSGAFSPKGPNEHFWQMDNQFLAGIGLRVGMERAWWTGMWGVEAAPDATTNAKLFPLDSKPATPNEETEYKAGQEFKIGFSGSKEGPEIDLEYTVQQEKTNKIPDWGVQNESAGNDLSWLFSSRGPCDPRPSADYKKCFDNEFPRDGTPVRPNELSLGSLPVRTSALWKTPRVLEGNAGKAAFTVRDEVTLIDTFCTRWVLGCEQGFPKQQLKRYPINEDKTSYGFDIGAVNPVPVKSLTFAPNPANGTKNDKVTGTVTLERPAPMDVRVKIFSNSENATVGGPIPNGGSSTTVKIPMGRTSGTFEALTNDNKLSPGQHTTATITAFYTTPTSAQLRVEAPATGR